MSETFFPEKFNEKYSQILGKEFPIFIKCCSTKISKSIWINSLKTDVDELVKELNEKKWGLKKLFHKNAFLISDKIQQPGASNEFKNGLFNLQEKSSMIPALVLNPKPDDFVLDGCAAPGNKTLQLSCLMKGNGKIIAVDNNQLRMRSLRYNVKKFKMKNVKVKQVNLLDYHSSFGFDKILLDAPCSSEGLVRKERTALKNWSHELVQKKSEEQKKLILKSFDLLKKEGEMVYSTCSLSPEENEEVISFLLTERKRAKLIDFKIKGFKFRKGMDKYNEIVFNKSINFAKRIWPHDNNSQGFFIAKIRKA